MLPERLRKAAIRRDLSKLNSDIKDVDFDEVAYAYNLKEDSDYDLLKDLSRIGVIEREAGEYHNVIEDPIRPGKFILSEYKESDPVLTHNQQIDSLQRYIQDELAGGSIPALPAETAPDTIAELLDAISILNPDTLKKYGGKQGMHGGATRRVADQPGVMAQYLYDIGLGRDRVYGDPITHQRPNQGHIVPNSASDKLTQLKEDLRLQGGYLNQILGNAENTEMIMAALDQLQGRRYVKDSADLKINQAEIKEAQRKRKLEKAKATRQQKKFKVSDKDLYEVDKIKAHDVDATNMKRFAGEDPTARKVLQAIESGRDTQSTGAVSGDKPVVIHAGEGSKVFLHTNGNGNRHAEMQEAFDRFNQ